MPEPLWKSNSAFLPHLPIQHSLDSTSLGALKTCARYYQLTIIEGWEPRLRSEHLTFGLWYHSATEYYDHQRANGIPHDTALISTVRYLLILSHGWQSTNDYKNRRTLLRTVVWYLDKYQEDTLKTILLTNGKPAVELSFRWQLPSSIAPSTSEVPYYSLCGHLDRLVEYQGDTYINDKKTSKSIIDNKFFSGFTPGNQMSLYYSVGSIVYNTPIKGIIIDGAQVAITFSAFSRGIISRTESQVTEWFSELPYWLNQAHTYATTNHWPMNDTACGNYGGCPFRGICSLPPCERDLWLQADFTKRIWDPLIARGDI
jgi:hypothetical protein